jgi:ubiquinone/menaquinone biosynthesis C-methylase UbiE
VCKDLCLCVSNISPAFNPDEFKAQQREMWDNAAAGWQIWWETFERGAQKVSNKLVELAEIKPGDKVLDIATGIGEPAVTAARRVKPNGKVVAIDISPQMLAIAKTRARSLGLDSVIEFIESDGEKIDLPDSTEKFDVILSRFGLMFFPNLSAALVKIREMLVTNGSLSAAVWSAPSKVPWLDLAFASVRKQINNAPGPTPMTLGPFALADVDALKQFFSQAGFRDIKTNTSQVTFEFDSPESYTKLHQQTASRIHAMLANQTEEVKKQAWNSITEAVWQYADSHGRVNLDNEVIYIVGKNKNQSKILKT